jgi:ATP-binding cassette subfamily B protein
MTLLNNLRYGQPESDKSRVQVASDTAQLTPDIAMMSDGFDTVVGERGVTLSGGQRQRSALVRSLLMNATILLLDDPFSSVDAQTENLIVDGLQARHQKKGLTTVVATQRFRWVRQADVVVVLGEQGQLVATGQHDELMQSVAFYRELVNEAEATTQADETSPVTKEVTS